MPLFNLPENLDQKDLNNVVETDKILSKMGVNIEPVKVLLIGIRLSNRPRPLQIILSENTDVFHVLKTKTSTVTLHPYILG